MLVLRQESCKVGTFPDKRSVAQSLEQGVVVIDKPRGPTSHEVSAFARKILGIEKTGHTGTLDANVSGVLLVLIGNSCKAARYVSTGRKSYECVMKIDEKVEKKDLVEAFSHFKGKIFQKPPLASAVAKRLRIREIFSLELQEFEGDEALFSVECEAGTYVRKLCNDVGEVLGCGASMSDLRRTSAGIFTEKQAHTLQELTDAVWLWKEKGKEENIRKMILPLEDAVLLKRVIADDAALKTISRGANLAIPGILGLDEGIKREEFVAIVSGKGELCCIGKAALDTEEIEEKKHGMAFDVERVIRSFA